MPTPSATLVGTEPELRSSCVRMAIQEDGRQVLLDQEAAEAVHRLPCRAELLWAERGLLDEPLGRYDAQRLDLAALDPERVTVTGVPPATTPSWSVRTGQP